MKWRNNDWYWLVGCLITIIILLIAGFYNSNKVALNFSIISSAVSIALALVAIFIALNQSNDNKDLSEEVKITMNMLHEKLNNVGEKVNKIDGDYLSKIFQQKMEDVSEEISENVQGKSAITNEELIEMYESELEKVRLDIDFILKEQNNLRLNKRFSNDMSLVEWSIGDKAKHRKWGVGKVIEVTGTGYETEVVVKFPEPVGRKKLLAKFAPIKKVM